VPTHKSVLFGHHFAAIAGAGPLNEAPYIQSSMQSNYIPAVSGGYFSVMKNQHEKPDSPRCC
jgi:hypothetical protein